MMDANAFISKARSVARPVILTFESWRIARYAPWRSGLAGGTAVT
jgi:hypothetical protein